MLSTLTASTRRLAQTVLAVFAMCAFAIPALAWTTNLAGPSSQTIVMGEPGFSVGVTYSTSTGEIWPPGTTMTWTLVNATGGANVDTSFGNPCGGDGGTGNTSIGINSVSTACGFQVNYVAGSFTLRVTPNAPGLDPLDFVVTVVPPSIYIDDVSANEGDTGTSPQTFTVSLNGRAPPGGVTFDIATAGGGSAVTTGSSITGGLDYVAKSMTAQTIPAGERSVTFEVTVNGDTTYEPNETYFVNLTNVTNASIGRGQGRGTIVNDDPPPSLSIDSVSLLEGDSGTTNFVFTVTATGISSENMRVNYTTADGTAIAGSDYTATSGTLDFTSSTRTRTITVPVSGDTTHEADETFVVNLSAPVNAVITNSQGVGTITNDDAAPTLAINDVTVSESDGSAVFTVTRTGATEQTVTVSYATANGTALAGSDYTAASGTLTFAPSPAASVTQTISVAILDNTLYEATESFAVNLSNATNATIAKNQGITTINDDDTTTVHLSISDVSLAEGNAGTTVFVFTVSLSEPAGPGGVTFDIATADGTAASSRDFDPHSQTGQTIPVGADSYFFVVPVKGDAIYEENENFYVNVTNVSGAILEDGQGIGTINNDDAPPTLSINDVSVSEAAGTATFTVTRSGATEVAPMVRFATANGTATAPADYLTSSGTLGFPLNFAATATMTITVPLVNDTAFEPDEIFFVNLSDASAATISDSQGIATIIDDDTPVTLTPTALPEGTAAVVYSHQLDAAGGDDGPYTFVIVTGTPPAGVTLSASGLISGTPTAAGSFPITVSATDGDGNIGQQSYTLVIASPDITIAPASLPGGQAGVAYNQTISATGGNGTYTYTVTTGDLPQGLFLASSGALTGTPTEFGTFAFTITASDQTTGPNARYSGSRDYSVVIQQAVPTIVGVAPNSGPMAGGQSVTITGTDFQNTSSVTFGGVTASFTVDTPTSITATTPAHAEGSVDVVIATPGGIATGAGAYTYIAPGNVRFVINGSDDGAYVFTSPMAALNFTVATSGGAGQSADISLAPGSYALSFTTPDGTGIAAANCAPSASTVNTATKTAALVIASHVTTVCTIDALAARRVAVEAIGAALDASSRLILANGPSLSRRLDRLNGRDAGDGTASAFGKTLAAGLPFSAQIGANEMRFSMSFSGIRKKAEGDHRFASANDNGVPTSLSASVKPAAGLPATAGGEAAAALATRGGSRFDIWVEGLLSQFDAAANSSGHFAIVHAGADYLVTDDLLIGLGIQGDWLALDTASGGIDSSGWLAGPYLTARISSNLYLDARAAWGGANFDVSPFGTYTDKVSSDRELYSAALIGAFEIGQLTIRPEARVSWYREVTDAYVDSLAVAIPSVEIQTGEVSFGPDFEWTLPQDNGGVFTPRIGFDLIWTFQQDNAATQFTGAPGLSDTGIRGRIEGGLAYVDPRGVEFGGTLFYDGIGGGDYSAWGGALKIRLGF